MRYTPSAIALCNKLAPLDYSNVVLRITVMPSVIALLIELAPLDSCMAAYGIIMAQNDRWPLVRRCLAAQGSTAGGAEGEEEDAAAPQRLLHTRARRHSSLAFVVPIGILHIK